MKIFKFLRYLRFTRKEDEKSKAKPDDTASKSLFGKNHHKPKVGVRAQASTEKDVSSEKKVNAEKDVSTETKNDDGRVLLDPSVIDPFGPLDQYFGKSSSSSQVPNFSRDIIIPPSVPPGPYTKKRLIKITRYSTSTDSDGKVTTKAIKFHPIEQVYDTRHDFLASMGVSEENGKLAQDKTWTGVSASHRSPIADGGSGRIEISKSLKWKKDKNGKGFGEYTSSPTEVFYEMKPRTKLTKSENKLDPPPYHSREDHKK